MPKALTIAGSDSGGGAGIQADLKTFFAHGVYGSSVITALTAQNSVGVTGVHGAPPDFVAAQMRAVMSDIGSAAAKTGMLANAAIIHAVVEMLGEFPIPNLVVDPVMVATSGDHLLEPDAVDAYRKLLVPLARVVTPNIAEAEALTGIKIAGEDDMHMAAEAIVAMGARAALIKGGHLADAEWSNDVLLDAGEFEIFTTRRVASANTHGSGCTLSAAIAAQLALGRELHDAVGMAKEFVTGAIKNSYAVGAGPGPLNHAWRLTKALSDNPKSGRSG